MVENSALTREESERIPLDEEQNVTESEISILQHDRAFGLLWVDKPAGLLSVPGRGQDKQDCVVARVRALLEDESVYGLRQHTPNTVMTSPEFACTDETRRVRKRRQKKRAAWDGVRECHRLDMATSGVMLLATRPDVHRIVMQQFQTGCITKGYEAIVAGWVEDDAGEIMFPLRLDVENRPKQIVDDKQGKNAMTLYEVIERYTICGAKVTRVRLTPKTGRTHQLRVHLSEFGHPILGDKLYAPLGVCDFVLPGLSGSRLLLHAHWLELDQPVVEGVRCEEPSVRLHVESLLPF